MNSVLRKLLPLTLGLFLSGFAFGQTGTVKGTIRDKSTGETLPGANVLLKGTLTGASADFNGNYVLEHVAAGSATIEVSFVGYLPQTKTITVNAGKTAE